MTKPFSQYLEAVESRLPSKHHRFVRGDLYLTVLDWYTDGVEPHEAATRIRNAIGNSP
jgi:hypothetical protein